MLVTIAAPTPRIGSGVTSAGTGGAVTLDGAAATTTGEAAGCVGATGVEAGPDAETLELATVDAIGAGCKTPVAADL